MSALQKYKKEALALREENARLLAENEKLSAGLPSIVCPPAEGKDVKEQFIAMGNKVLKQIYPLIQDHGGIPLAGCYIAEALFKAYTAGKEGEDES